MLGSFASFVLQGKVYEKHTHVSAEIFVRQLKSLQTCLIYQQGQRRHLKQ